MDETRCPPTSFSPENRALRQVMRLNEEIGYQFRRIVGLKDTEYAAMSLLMRGPMGSTESAEALHVTSASATAVVNRPVRLPRSDGMPRSRV